MTLPRRRRLVGAEPAGDGTDFRVWAPDKQSVSVVIDGKDFALERDDGGHFRGFVPTARAGTRYRFRLNGSSETFPDPASRFQPDGPHGPSAVIDPQTYRWRDREWRGLQDDGLVIYEMHIGTFTQEGTWRAAATRLPRLSSLGINLVEVMPIGEFPGRFGWGYDGVDLWAPTRLYGTPDDFRAFVDAAHEIGMAVILDVVYNHFGPDGCYLREFTDRYFTDRYWNEWGDSVNFDGEGSDGVREFVSENAAYWIDEFHLDGLRLDATQSIHDFSPVNIMSVIARCARQAADDRKIILVAENERQEVKLIGQYGLDAMWNDDWHHAAMVAATGRREAYYTDYHGSPQEFISMARFGFLYQGQRYSWQKDRRGTPSLDLPPRRLICYLQNHDQVANSERGERIQHLTPPGRYRALTALLLLGPNTPMLFQGQEFASSAPFLYFADHKQELAAAVDKGRREFMKQFPSIDTDRLAPPADPATFQACKLDHGEWESHPEAVALHRELLKLRREMRGRVEGAVLGPDALVLRFFGDEHRLLIVNLGSELHLEIAPEPLLAPPAGAEWKVLWSTEPVPPLETEDGWRIPGPAAVVLTGGHPDTERGEGAPRQ